MQLSACPKSTFKMCASCCGVQAPKSKMSPFPNPPSVLLLLIWCTHVSPTCCPSNFSNLRPAPFAWSAPADTWTFAQRLLGPAPCGFVCMRVFSVVHEDSHFYFSDPKRSTVLSSKLRYLTKSLRGQLRSAEENLCN